MIHTTPKFTSKYGYNTNSYEWLRTMPERDVAVFREYVTWALSIGHTKSNTTISIEYKNIEKRKD